MRRISFRVRYDGAGPVHWSGGTTDFGLQDKAETLLQGVIDERGRTCFDFFADMTLLPDGAADFHGAFVHGKPGGRFLYLAWRNREGNYAQRFKLPLERVTVAQAEQAMATGGLLQADLVVAQQRATSTGANIGGTRDVAWTLSPAASRP